MKQNRKKWLSYMFSLKIFERNQKVILHLALMLSAVFWIFATISSEPRETSFLNRFLSLSEKVEYWSANWSRRIIADCLSNQFLLEKLMVNCLLIDFISIFLVLIMRPNNLTTPILKAPILSPNCYSNFGMNIYTFSSLSILFSIFCKRVSLLLQFFWLKICSINLTCI